VYGFLGIPALGFSALIRQLALDIILNSAILNRTTQKGLVFSAHSHQGESFGEGRCGFLRARHP
jgi:hypothetical protein